MASGHPDYLDFAGRSSSGGAMTSYSFSGSIAGASLGTTDFPIVAAGTENIYQCLTLSCNDDSAIHSAYLIRVSDSWIFFRIDFITGGIFDFPGQAFEPGQTCRLVILNNSANTLTFAGAINYVTRSI